MFWHANAFKLIGRTSPLLTPATWRLTLYPLACLSSLTVSMKKTPAEAAPLSTQLTAASQQVELSQSPSTQDCSKKTTASTSPEIPSKPVTVFAPVMKAPLPAKIDLILEPVIVQVELTKLSPESCIPQELSSETPFHSAETAATRAKSFIFSILSKTSTNSPM